MADGVFVFEKLSYKNVSSAWSRFSFMVDDTDGVTFLYASFQTLNALKETLALDDLAVENRSILVSCQVYIVLFQASYVFLYIILIK